MPVGACRLCPALSAEKMQSLQPYRRFFFLINQYFFFHLLHCEIWIILSFIVQPTSLVHNQCSSWSRCICSRAVGCAKHCAIHLHTCRASLTFHLLFQLTPPWKFYLEHTYHRAVWREMNTILPKHIQDLSRTTELDLGDDELKPKLRFSVRAMKWLK